MSDLLIASIYRIIIIIIGFITFFVGVYLLNKGKHTKSELLAVKWGNFELKHKVVPGLLVCLLGIAIIVISIIKGIDSKSHTIKKSENRTELPETLIIDTSTLKFQYSSLNVDSIFNIGHMAIKEKQYLLSLKYLYIVKGILLAENKENILLEKVNSDIRLSEAILSSVLNKKSENNYIDETKDTKIKEENNDSVR